MKDLAPTLLVRKLFLWLAVALFLLAATAFTAPQRTPDNGSRAQTTRSPHGPLAIPCQNCHTFSGWKPIRQRPEFDHNRTRYPLRGMHQSVGCMQCHTSLVFSKVGQQCADCHADIHRRQMGAQCQQCHTVLGWTTSIRSIREHSPRFPLLGAHALLTCDNCHKNAAAGQFQGLPTDCVGCHVDRFMSPNTQPNHRALGFPTSCQQCHTSVDTWVGAKFDHAQFGGFALTGAHANLPCASCHIGGKFTAASTACVSCHQADFNNVKDPNHVQAGFPTTCQQCHTTTSWLGAKFDHTAFTKFPLTGAHTTVACASCHVNGKFQGTPTTCVSCHQTDFNGAKNPDHLKLGFPQTCEQCHTTASWTASFDHSTTGFVLTGAHTTTPCTSCHVGGKFAGTPATCIGCHQADFNGVKDPDHVKLGFPTTCQQCHNTTSWTTATFDHSTTGFPLTGAHTTVACTSCHVGGKYQGTPATCISCHQTDFNNVKNPDHVKLGFPTTCQQCHTTTSWSGATFDHAALTGFALTGAHATVACTQCHVNGRFAGTPRDCASCHLTDFNGTTNPNHKAAGFPTDCSLCHTTTNWAGAVFDHSKTLFPLTGAHVSQPCSACHASGVFAGLSTACASCHLTNFNNTKNPNHVSSGFPQTCEICHSTTAWTPATFDHSKTVFPLTGAHVNVACASCHIGGKFAGTPTDCYSCHKADYNSVTNPNHVAAQFPTTCATCHTTTSWAGATFNHTWFPIYSGTHAGKWTTCGDCHTNPSNFVVFSCITCHQHSQATTDPNHRGVRNYVYNATSCYTCHPTGRSN